MNTSNHLMQYVAKHCNIDACLISWSNIPPIISFCDGLSLCILEYFAQYSRDFCSLGSQVSQVLGTKMHSHQPPPPPPTFPVTFGKGKGKSKTATPTNKTLISTQNRKLATKKTKCKAKDDKIQGSRTLASDSKKV